MENREYESLGYTITEPEIEVKSKKYDFVAMCPYCFLSHDKCDCERNKKREFVTIDTMIFPTISLLNRKGFITNFCCSGHYRRGWEETYISFIKDYGFVAPRMVRGKIDNLFAGSRISISYKGPRRNLLNDYSEEEILKKIKEINDNLYEWAEELKPIKNIRKFKKTSGHKFIVITN